MGVYKRNGEPSPKLDQFALTNNLEIEQVIVKGGQDELKELTENKKVDAILSTELAIEEHSGMYAIAHFSPMPFYFATTKGNIDIARQLDYAISTIDQVTPNFSVQLSNKYFSKLPNEFRLTDDEKAFIKNADVQEVLLYNNPPFSYVDKKTNDNLGITIELLDYITKLTGLKFNINIVSSFDEFVEKSNSGKMDIIADVLLNSQESADNNSSLTIPWRGLPIHSVFKEGTKVSSASRFAVPNFLKNLDLPYENITYYNTAEQSLDAVEKGRAEVAILDGFSEQYLRNSGKYNTVKFLTQQENLPESLCFGIVNNRNFYLLSIFNKCISFIPVEELEGIVYKNTYIEQDINASIWLKNNFIYISVITLAVIVMFLIISINFKNKQQKMIAFENKRYTTLSNLSNEFFYEYDVEKDILSLPDKCAKYFSCDSVIERFSEKLVAIDEEDRFGIWYIGPMLIENKEIDIEVSCQMTSGSRQWLRIVTSQINNGEQAANAYTIGKITDIQDIKAEQIRWEQRSLIDGLTGVYNISAIKSLVYQKLENFDEYKPCAFVITDIDNFKQINDKFGHYSGDMVLVHMASAIKEVFDDISGRLGGDEFIIFATNTTHEKMEEKCRLLCKIFEEKVKDSMDITATLSVGVSMAFENKSYETLYKEADKALYKRKSANKNGYYFFDND